MCCYLGNITKIVIEGPPMLEGNKLQVVLGGLLVMTQVVWGDNLQQHI